MDVIIKKLFQQRWDFELYEVGNKKVITVIFFGQVDYPRSFFLEKEIEENEYGSLKELSEKIRNHYAEFKHLEIVPPINL